MTTRRRSPLLWGGVALMLAGLVVLGWLAWQFWGTTWVAHRQQHDLVTSTERGWAKHAPGRSGGRAGRSEAGRGAGRDRPPDGVTAIVRIPRFGASYAVPVLEGTSASVLARGFGHFPHTQGPGQVGNYALAGHRVTHGEPLRRMPELRPGDLVVVSTRTATFRYRLDTDPRRLVVPFTAGWVLGRVPHNPAGGVQPPQRRGQRLLTLTTCSELFHTDDRMIAFGHLLGRSPAGPRGAGAH